LDLQAEWTVQAKNFYSQSKLSPFDGMVFKGKPAATIVDGRIVMKRGEVSA